MTGDALQSDLGFKDVRLVIVRNGIEMAVRLPWMVHFKDKCARLLDCHAVLPTTSNDPAASRIMVDYLTAVRNHYCYCVAGTWTVFGQNYELSNPKGPPGTDL